MHTLTTVLYGRAPTPFGPGLIGWTDQGTVILHFQQNDDPPAEEILLAAFPDCRLMCLDREANERLEQVFDQGQPGHSIQMPELVLTGSPFQLKVWQGLRDIPFGETRSYGQLAASIGHPGAARAVGTAIAANKLAYLVPCHRVVRATGEIGQFRWGRERKAQMLAWESRALADSNADR